MQKVTGKPKDFIPAVQQGMINLTRGEKGLYPLPDENFEENRKCHFGRKNISEIEDGNKSHGNY